MKKSLFVLASLCLVACSKNDLPKYASLDRLRILGLAVNTPEIQNPAAGTINVQMTPYLSDVTGTGTVSLEVQSCLDTGVNLGAEPNCQGAATASSVQTVVATFADPERTGTPAGAITVPLQVPANLLSSYSPSLQHNGVAYLITVKATRGSDVVRSFRRVLMSTKTPNVNPALSDLLVNGNTLNSMPSGEVELSFTAATAPETYQWLTSDGNFQTQTEVYETTWFISDGEIESPRSKVGETITWKAPGAAPTGRQAVVVGVLRDGRGGLDVIIRKF
jgi:hypothetical protein